MNKVVKNSVIFFFLSLLVIPIYQVYAQNNLTIPLLTTSQSHGNVTYSLSLKIILLMSFLAVLPALLMTATAFTRIVIVMAIVKQALGLPNIPSNQIIIGLSLIMTLFVMSPAINKINDAALQPYLQGKISDQEAFNLGSNVLKNFMLKQTRKADLNLFAKIAKVTSQKNPENYSLLVIMPSFITSELKTAFEIGFLIFLPFLIIDLVIASILMSMGMMMLSPMIISLPFKILFFILVDGWTLIVTSLITSFRV